MIRLWRNWCGWPELVGPSQNALRRPRERWVRTSMKSGNGMAGTGTSPWRCWPTPAWRWSGARRWNQEVRGQRGRSQLGRKADTPDGARGPAVALPADMETSTYGRISAAVVPVETTAPGNGPPLPLPTPPETPHHISATVVLGRDAGGCAVGGAAFLMGASGPFVAQLDVCQPSQQLRRPKLPRGSSSRTTRYT